MTEPVPGPTTTVHDHVRGWRISRSAGPAGPFHHRLLPDPVVPEIWIHEVTAPALVLGSAQAEHLVHRSRAAAAGVEVVRRRSGGGLVTLTPGNGCWIDVLLPHWSPLWSDDIGRAFAWVGQAWAEALGTVLDPSAGGVSVHCGPLLNRSSGRAVCFAGLGPGEVSVAGNKVVGLSMRRWRGGARFQCAMIERWEPDLIADLADPAVIHPALAADGLTLERIPAGLPPGAGPVDPQQVVQAVLDHLPHPGSAPPDAPPDARGR